MYVIIARVLKRKARGAGCALVSTGEDIRLTTTVAHPNPWRISPQRLAWGVMLGAFTIFCAIVIIFIIGLQYFLFQSRIPMISTVQVARGTATLVGSDLLELAVKGSRDISGSSVLTTDTQSQASVSFYDQHSDDRLVAIVTLKNGSSLNIQEDSRPRFDFSGDPYWIDFQDSYGEFDVYVPDKLDRPILIGFETTLGPAARLSASGRYTLIAAGAQVQVINYSGEALLGSAPDMKRNQLVPAGQSVSMQANSGTFSLTPTVVNLLGDTTFNPDNVLDYNAASDQVRASAWRCNNVQVAPPDGSFGLVMEDGRPALLLHRGDNAESHGETRCFQGLGSGVQGLDITKFSRLTLKATFKIQSQSLSACGADGSECPLMLAMDYYPPPSANGQKTDPVTWYHGFYAFVDPNRVFPSRCSSCNEEHEAITPGTWYTYENRNFLQAFADDQRPTAILNLRFYASGHQYDVYVDSVELLVDAAEMTAAGQ